MIKFNRFEEHERLCTPQPQATSGFTVTASDIQHLPIDPGTLTMQPAQDWVLINIETIAYTTAAPQEFDTTLLDTPIRVRVTPTAYTWDFAEGQPFTTTHPGAPYPDHTVWYR